MKRKILSIAFGLVVVPSAIMAQTAATEHTIRANEAVKTELDFNDRQDFEDASRGFIATVNTSAIMTEGWEGVLFARRLGFLEKRCSRNCESESLATVAAQSLQRSF